jgi:predicted AAA+ superfamily ATPase
MYTEAFAEFFYWRLAGGTEVDFIVNDMEVAIEVKSSEKISARHLKGLRSLKVDHPDVGRRIIVCNEKKLRTTEDDIEIIPAVTFATMLWRGDIF